MKNLGAGLAGIVLASLGLANEAEAAQRCSSDADSSTAFGWLGRDYL